MAVVYKHIRKDTNEVFYIGIGRTNKRPYNFVKRSLHHKNIIKKAGVEVEIVCENITWDEACEMGIKLIKEYGRMDLGNGPLINRTDGGEGSRNFVFSEEEKNRRSEYAKRQHREGKIDYNKISKTLSNKTLSNERRKKISEGVIKVFDVKGRKPKKIKPKRNDLVWVNKNGFNKRVGSSDVDNFINDGWELGMIKNGKKEETQIKKICSSKYVWINKNLKSKRICEDILNEYLNSGWVRGRYLLKSNKNFIWINNGIKDILISQNQIKHYLNLKWNYGRITMKNSKKHGIQN
jgi:hypothetical protein